MTWADLLPPTGYATIGGFPYHLKGVSELFDETVLAVPIYPGAAPEGAMLLNGKRVTVQPLLAPVDPPTNRRLAFLRNLVPNVQTLWSVIQKADAVHVPVPGDMGMVGIMLALVQRKRLFVRHCGNWLAPRTRVERFLKWLMIRYAGGRNVMLVTGGGEAPPSTQNPHLAWVFSTSLTHEVIDTIGRVRAFDDPANIRLLTASRQEPDKGTDIVLQSLPALRDVYPGIHLDVVGDGNALDNLKALARRLGVDDLVTFHGRVAHARVLQLMQQAHVFTYPTRASEGFPKVVLEALATGLPVLTTPVSVLPHLMRQGGGCILPEARPELLVQGLMELLADPLKGRAMSEAALATARKYSLEAWQKVLEEHLVRAWGPLRHNE